MLVVSEQETQVAQEEVEPIFKFFRYVRPLDTHPKSVGRLAPHGGISFYIELNPAMEEMKFSFTICRDDEAFVKQLARDQTQARFLNGEVYVIENYDRNSWVVDNIMFALHSYLGYEALSFTPKNYPVVLPSFESVPPVVQDDNQHQTLELLLAKLLRDNQDYVLPVDPLVEAALNFREAHANLMRHLLV